MAKKKAEAAPKEVAEVKEVIMIREIPADLQKALDVFMESVNKSKIPVSRKRMVEKIVRYKLKGAIRS